MIVNIFMIILLVFLVARELASAADSDSAHRIALFLTVPIIPLLILLILVVAYIITEILGYTTYVIS